MAEAHGTGVYVQVRERDEWHSFPMTNGGMEAVGLLRTVIFVYLPPERSLTSAWNWCVLSSFTRLGSVKIRVDSYHCLLNWDCPSGLETGQCEVTIPWRGQGGWGLCLAGGLTVFFFITYVGQVSVLLLVSIFPHVSACIGLWPIFLILLDPPETSFHSFLHVAADACQPLLFNRDI